MANEEAFKAPHFVSLSRRGLLQRRGLEMARRVSELLQPTPAAHWGIADYSLNAVDRQPMPHSCHAPSGTQPRSGRRAED